MTTDAITLREFFETVPPGQSRAISDLATRTSALRDGKPIVELLRPDIELFCDNSETCGRMQMFRTYATVAMLRGATQDSFINYQCRNCGRRFKTYAVSVLVNDDARTGVISKYGESPQFGPPNPPRLISLFRDDKESFLKGRRAENQGMGVGAFAYYRRVIESQKNRLLDKVLAVSKLYNAAPELLGELEAAKAERQFTKAINTIKHGLPDALLINGQNPLTLMHDALSEGLHAETDEDCLEIATDIRVVMAAFAERLAEAVKEDAELKQSVARLIQKKANRGRPAQMLEGYQVNPPASKETADGN